MHPSCKAQMDQNNNTIGMGNDDCWDINKDSPKADKYITRCPSVNDVCKTELMADWSPRGFIKYHVSRFCSSEPPKICNEGSSSVIQYKGMKYSTTSWPINH